MFGFNPEKALANAEKYVQQGRFAQAIELYEKVLKQQPTNLHLRNNLGDLYARAGRNDEAIKMFREVADHFDQQGMSQRAIAILKKIIKLDPNAGDAQQRVAQLLVSQGGQSEARTMLMTTVDRAERAGDWAGAATALAQAISIDGEQPRLRVRLARIRLKQGDKKRAQAELLAAAEYLLAQKDYDGAALAIKDVAVLDASAPRYRLLVAKWEQAQGHAEKALAALPPAAQIGELEADAGTVWRIAFECGDVQQAIVLGAAAVRAGHSGVITDLGSALIEQKDFEAAARWPRYDEELFRRQDLRAAWIEHLRNAFKADQSCLPVLETWAEIAGNDKDICREPLLNLARANALEDRLEKALDCYRRLAEAFPDDAEVTTNIQQLEQRLGTAQPAVRRESRASEPEPQVARPPAARHEPEAEEPAPAQSARAGQTVEFAITPTPPESQPEETSAPARHAPAAAARASADDDNGAIELDLATEWPENAVDDLDERAREIQYYITEGKAAEAEERLRRALAQRPGEPRLVALKEKLAKLQPEEGGSTAFIVTPVPEDSEEIIELESVSEGESSEDEAAAESWDDSGETVEFDSETTADGEAENDVIEVEADAEDTGGSPSDIIPLEEELPAAAQPQIRQVREEAPLPQIAKPPAQHKAPAAAAADGASKRSGGLLDDVFSDLRADLASEMDQSPQAFEFGESRPRQAERQHGTPKGQRSAHPRPAKPGLLDDVFHEFRASVETPNEESKSDPEARYNMGVAYREMGLQEEALAELQKAFAAWQKLPEAGQKLLSCGATIALCFQDSGMPELAVQWYENTLRHAELPAHDLIGMRYELARLLESLGRNDEALKLYRQVYATDVDYQDVSECLKRLQAVGAR